MVQSAGRVELGSPSFPSIQDHLCFLCFLCVLRWLPSVSVNPLVQTRNAGYIGSIDDDCEKGNEFVSCMNTGVRICMFGTVSGLLWSLVPGFLTEMFSSTVAVVTVLVSGIITGISVSCILYCPLIRFGRWGALLLGVISLPAGGFFFGVFLSIVGLVVGHATGDQRFVEGGFHPLRFGVLYAAYSVMSVLGIILIPAAVRLI